MYALVTGATSGIGKAIAFELAKKGYDLLLSARRIEELNAVKNALEGEFGVQAVVLPCDLSIRSNIATLHKEAMVYQPEIVVNNAGFGRVNLFADIPLEDDLTMIETNVVALHMLTKLFVRSMNSGVILNVASMVAFLPTPLMATYSATKAYVASLGRAVNFELKATKSKVRVLTLCPGPVDTNFAKVAGVREGLKGISAEACAKFAVRGIVRKKGIIIPDWRMRFTFVLLKIVPLSWIIPLSFELQKTKR